MSIQHSLSRAVTRDPRFAAVSVHILRLPLGAVSSGILFELHLSHSRRHSTHYHENSYVYRTPSRKLRNISTFSLVELLAPA